MKTTIPSVETVDRDKHWFDAYSFCLTFSCDGLPGLRSMSHRQLDYYIQHRQAMRSINFGGSWQQPRQTIGKEHAKELHDLCDYFLICKQDFKLTISGSIGHLYCHDISTVKSLLKTNLVKPIKVRKSVLSLPRDTLLIKNTKHKFRTYFSAQRISVDEKSRMHNFFDNHKNIRLGPSMMDFFVLYKRSTYISSNNFIDYTNEQDLFLLQLTSSVKIKKTVKLINHK